jgi:hypothetical protein
MMLAQLHSQGTQQQQSWESIFHSSEIMNETIDGAIEDYHINELQRHAELYDARITY